MKKFNEEEHPRNSEGEFISKDIAELSAEQLKQKILSEQVKKTKMTPAEKIASVHIDFDKDNILPELNDSELAKVGAKTNKPVLVKKNIIDRNFEEHNDLTAEDFQSIVAQALYTPSEVFAAHRDKPYFHFAKVIEINSKGKPEIGLALLDIDENKDNFELVHAYFVGSKAYERAKKKG